MEVGVQLVEVALEEEARDLAEEQGSVEALAEALAPPGQELDLLHLSPQIPLEAARKAVQCHPIVALERG